MLCPNDGCPLDEIAPTGIHSCPKCKGKAFSRHALEERFKGLHEALRPETDAYGKAFDRPRHCPRCSQETAPLKIDQDAAWVYRCQACDLYWIDILDRSVGKALQGRLAHVTRPTTVLSSERIDAIGKNETTRWRVGFGEEFLRGTNDSAD